VRPPSADLAVSSKPSGASLILALLDTIVRYGATGPYRWKWCCQLVSSFLAVGAAIVSSGAAYRRLSRHLAMLQQGALKHQRPAEAGPLV